MNDTGFFERSGWGVVSVQGDDTWSFLQNLVSQDLDPLGDGDATQSLLLTPQGRIVSEFRVLRVGEMALLDTANGSDLASALRRYLLRVAVEIEDLTGAWSMLSVRGDEQVRSALSALDASTPGSGHHVAAGFDGDVRVVAADWSDVPGIDLVGPTEALDRVEALFAGAGIATLGDEAVEALRISAGVPRFGVDFDESTLPHEVLLDRHAVSFTKGCFLGQEIVGRIDARGRAPKLLRRVEVEASDGGVPAVGSSVRDADDAVVGTLTSVAALGDDGAVGLAVLPVAIEPPADVTIDGMAARVVAIP